MSRAGRKKTETNRREWISERPAGWSVVVVMVGGKKAGGGSGWFWWREAVHNDQRS